MKAPTLWADEFVRKRLVQPLKADGIEGIVAERFVFDIDAPTFVQDLIDGGSLDNDALSGNITAPDAPVWIEYPMTFADGSAGQLGTMLDRVKMADHPLANEYFCMVVVGCTHDSPAVPIAMMTINEFPVVKSQTMLMPVFMLDKLGTAMDDTDIQQIIGYIREVHACMFLLQTPRVVELKRASFGNPKKKHQTSLKPFVEVHRVKMRIGIPEPRYERTGTGTAPGEPHKGIRKYHRVMPHFRTYGRDTGQPKAKLIESFWRGNPEKGIVLHERMVQVGKDLKHET